MLSNTKGAEQRNVERSWSPTALHFPRYYKKMLGFLEYLLWVCKSVGPELSWICRTDWRCGAGQGLAACWVPCAARQEEEGEGLACSRQQKAHLIVEFPFGSYLWWAFSTWSLAAWPRLAGVLCARLGSQGLGRRLGDLYRSRKGKSRTNLTETGASCNTC